MGRCVWIIMKHKKKWPQSSVYCALLVIPTHAVAKESKKKKKTQQSTVAMKTNIPGKIIQSNPLWRFTRDSCEAKSQFYHESSRFFTGLNQLQRFYMKFPCKRRIDRKKNTNMSPYLYLFTRRRPSTNAHPTLISARRTYCRIRCTCCWWLVRCRILIWCSNAFWFVL